MKLRAFSSADIKAAVPMARAVEAMKDVYVQVSSGLAVIPLRLPLAVEKHSGVTLVMPAYLSGSGGLGAKIVEVNPEPTPLSSPADFSFPAKAGEILPLIDERLPGGQVGT